MLLLFVCINTRTLAWGLTIVPDHEVNNLSVQAVPKRKEELKRLRTTSTVVRALEQLVYASCSVQGSASYSERTELEHKLSAN